MHPVHIVAIALPTLTVLVGILLNQASSNRLDARISALEVSLRAEMSALRGEMNAFCVSMHNDVVMLLGRGNKLDARVSRLEQAVS